MTAAATPDLEAAKSDASGKRARRRFTVDIWATDLSDVEIGIMPQTQHRAKSDQFTKDMDILGAVKENGERTGIVAYRESLWTEKTGMARRLVFKLFSKSMNWRGTMEMTLGRSLQLSLGAGLPVTSFSVNLARHDQVITVERSADQWLFLPEKFTFFITEQGETRFYTLRQNVISIGADYSILDSAGRKIGLIDGKLLSIGGAWHVSLDKAHDTPRLASVLQLFCTMLKFNKAARAHVRDLAADVGRGRRAVDIDHSEKDLYNNPRRWR